MSIQGFRDAYTRDSGNVDFGEMHTGGELAAGQVTPWYNLSPKKGLPCTLGTIVKCIYVLTATGPESPVAGSDVLDPILNGSDGGQLDMGSAPGAAGRSQSLTRPFIEFVYAACTNTAFSIASLPTFASAGTATVTVSFFVPLGGTAGSLRIRLPATIAHSYSAGVTVSYTSITTQIISTTYTGVAAFRQEKSASLGTGLQSYIQYLPKDIAPDAAFMDGETSSSITQVLITYLNEQGGLVSTDTDALQIGAASFAPISGTMYTTSAGFVMTLAQKQFASFQLQFASATTHYIGFIQVAGGEPTISNLQPDPTQATPAVEHQGSVTASGQVAAANAGKQGVRMARGGTRSRYTYRGR